MSTEDEVKKIKTPGTVLDIEGGTNSESEKDLQEGDLEKFDEVKEKVEDKDFEDRSVITEEKYNAEKQRMLQEGEIEELIKRLEIPASCVTSDLIDLFRKHKFHKHCEHEIDWVRVRRTTDGRSFVFDCGHCSNMYVVLLGKSQESYDFDSMERLVVSKDTELKQYKIENTFLKARINELDLDRESLSKDAIPSIHKLDKFLSVNATRLFWSVSGAIVLGGVVVLGVAKLLGVF